MTPLSDSEARTVARFENAEPAPESWSGGLREALAQRLFNLRGYDWPWEEHDTPHHLYGEADYLLALPEIAALRAKAAAADRVRALVDKCWPDDDQLHPALRSHSYRTRFLAALDGPPPC